MIGQKYLKKYVQTLIEEDNFPQFSIFVGPKGSGKKTFMREYFDGIYPEDNKVDSIRKIIDMAYKVAHKRFIIPDADDMSNAAKNASCPSSSVYFTFLPSEESYTADFTEL